jgi:hypothetical protein
MKQYNQEKVAALCQGDSFYLKGKDCEKGRKIRPLVWFYQGEDANYVPYLEGWVVDDQDSSKSHPVRFDIEEDIDLNDYNWKMSSFQNQPEKPQLPSAVFGMLVWDYKTKSIMLATWSQVQVRGAFWSFMDPDNANYIEGGIHTCDFVVEMKEQNKKISYTVQVVPKCKDEIPEEAIAALRNFTFSWEDFIASEDPRDETSPNIKSFEDIEFYKDISSPSKAKPGNKQTFKGKKKTEVEHDESKDFDLNDMSWMKVSTPNGRVLGTCSLKELQEFQRELEKLPGGTEHPLYNKICHGIVYLAKNGNNEESDASQESLEKKPNIKF